MNKAVAKVIEGLGGGRYLLELATGEQIKGYLSGKMKQNRIKLSPGDMVELVLDPYGGSATNRIIWRK